MDVTIEGTIHLRAKTSIPILRREKWIDYPYKITFSKDNWDVQRIANGAVKVWCERSEDRNVICARVKSIPVIIRDVDPNEPSSFSFLLDSISSVQFAGRVTVL